MYSATNVDSDKNAFTVFANALGPALRDPNAGVSGILDAIIADVKEVAGARDRCGEAPTRPPPAPLLARCCPGPHGACGSCTEEADLWCVCGFRALLLLQRGSRTRIGPR